jgi:hypothetical protein
MIHSKICTERFECYRTATPQDQTDSLLYVLIMDAFSIVSYLGRNVGEDDSIALEPPLGRRHLDIRLPNLTHKNNSSEYTVDVKHRAKNIT